MRRRFEEPCTINGDVIAEYLHRNGCPRMASFVRHLSDLASNAGARERELMDEIARLSPPERIEQPMSYRSQWD